MQIAIPERVIERAIQQKYFNVTASANFLGVSPSTFRIWLKSLILSQLVLMVRSYMTRMSYKSLWRITNYE